MMLARRSEVASSAYDLGKSQGRRPLLLKGGLDGFQSVHCPSDVDMTARKGPSCHQETKPLNVDNLTLDQLSGNILIERGECKSE